jgi:hypothetical protein
MPIKSPSRQSARGGTGRSEITEAKRSSRTSVASALAGDKPFQQLQHAGNSGAKHSHLMGMAVQLALIRGELAVCSFNKGIDPALKSADQLRLHQQVLFQLGEPFFSSHSPSDWIVKMNSVSAIASPANRYYTLHPVTS